MKKLVVLLMAIVLIQSYGIFGAIQADRIIYTCEVEVGPLCYSWNENAFTKLLGNENAEKIEKELSKAKESFEKDFLDKLFKDNKRKSNWSNFLNNVSKKASEGIDKAKQAADKVINDMEKK